MPTATTFARTNWTDTLEARRQAALEQGVEKPAKKAPAKRPAAKKATPAKKAPAAKKATAAKKQA